MSEHFIKNIEIKNFKCFENFKAEGFGRVNLIAGKNNVGKTAFMESLYLNTASKTLNNLLFSISEIEGKRNQINNLEPNIIDILTDYKSFSISGKNKIKYSVNISSIEKSLTIKLNDIEKNINFMHTINFISNKEVTFLGNYGFTNFELKMVFEAVQKKDKENELNGYIKKFDSDIENFKIIGGDKPQCKVKTGEYRDIAKFGDGLKQYISIICSLYKSNNSYLYLDEIENGIHYTNLDKLWKIILSISKEQNVQVFATTHSKECIESYARVAKKLEDKEITFIKMTRLKDGEIMAGVRDYDMLQYTMSNGHEVRGV